MTEPVHESAARIAVLRARPWMDQVPQTARTQDWKEAVILLDLALEAKANDVVVDILHTCATVPCRVPYLLQCDRPQVQRPPKEWCGPCRARKLLGYKPTP